MIENKHPAPILITTTTSLFTSQIIYHSGGEPEQAMHDVMEHKPWITAESAVLWAW